MASPFDSFDPPTVYAALQELPQTSGVVTADTIRLTTLFLSNTSDTDRKVTVTNTAGTAYVSLMSIPANTPAPLLEFPYLRAVGLKWYADGAGVNGQVEGYPDV